METLEAIMNRRSIRKFSAEDISDEHLDIIMKAAMAAPSACDRRVWEYYIVKNKETQEKVKKGITFGKFDAPMIIIVCFKEKKALPFVMHDTNFCDLSASIENMLLAITDLGLGAVWCAIYPNPRNSRIVRKAIGAPVGITPFSAVFVGHRAEDEKGKVKDKFDESRIHIIK